MAYSVKCIVKSYERKLKAARSNNGDLAAEGKALAKETEKARHYEDIAVERDKVNEDLNEQIVILKAERDQANAGADGLAAEKDALNVRLKSEQARLQNSRDKMVYRERIRARKDVKAKYAAKHKKMKRHLASRKEQDRKLLTLSQVTRTYDCLKFLAGGGFPVSEAVFEKLYVDQMKWEVELNTLDVVKLEDDDLEMSPLPPSRSRMRQPISQPVLISTDRMSRLSLPMMQQI